MSWISTFTGRRFDPLAPDPTTVCIEDIAHALALKCRWTGHTREHYSIADHSLRVCAAAGGLVSSSLPAWALMHDAAEAYLPDVARPIKASLVGFQEIEYRVLRAIAIALELPVEGSHPGENPIPVGLRYMVQHADDVLLVTEARDLVHGTDGWDWGYPPPLPARIAPLDVYSVERLFLERWRELEPSAAGEQR